MKRKTRRILMILLLLIIIAVAAIVAWYKYYEFTNRDPCTVIPDDAVFVMQTDNLSRGWKEVYETRFWETLLMTEQYEKITNTAASVDSVIQQNKTVSRMLKNRPLMISAHMTEAYHYDMLITVDLLRESKIVFLQDFILEVMKLYGYTIHKLNYNEHKIIEIIGKDSDNSFFVSFIDNIMVISFSEKLIKHSISKTGEDVLSESGAFHEAREATSKLGLMRFYLNYDKLNDLIRVYQQPQRYRALTDAISTVKYSGFDFNAGKSQIRLDGHTTYKDSLAPLINTLREIKPEKPQAFRIAPEETAIYLSLAFNDFREFHAILKNHIKAQEPSLYTAYEKHMDQIDKLLKTDVEKHLTSWIGQEIAYLKLQPGQKTSIKDAVIAVHAGDITRAKESMQKLNQQVKKNLPAHFEAKDYHGYSVYHLNISGMFRFFFSDMLSKIDKPYYSFIGDYVIFSNNIVQIYTMIDAYIREQTLIYNDTYMDFASEISSGSPVSIYIQTPYAFKLLHAHANQKTRQQLDKNKEVITSFSRIGLQYIPGSSSIQTHFLIHHDEDALYKASIQEMETSATELYSMKLQGQDLSFEIPEKHKGHSSFVNLYYDDSVTVRAKGELRRGKPVKNWRLYYRGGNLKALLPYTRGDLEGDAYFYYDINTQPLRCEAEFHNDRLHGEYNEYYKNGQLKASLKFRKNKPHGQARFYYTNGTIMIEGKYRKGSKRGNWKHYTPDGKVYDKQYWRKKMN
ncbi:MAG: DUF3352 domain-containing protein [Bacteroidales bacterium]